MDADIGKRFEEDLVRKSIKKSIDEYANNARAQSKRFWQELRGRGGGFVTPETRTIIDKIKVVTASQLGRDYHKRQPPTETGWSREFKGEDILLWAGEFIDSSTDNEGIHYTGGRELVSAYSPKYPEEVFGLTTDNRYINVFRSGPWLDKLDEIYKIAQGIKLEIGQFLSENPIWKYLSWTPLKSPED